MLFSPVLAASHLRRPPFFGFVGTCPDHVGEVPTGSESTSPAPAAARSLHFRQRDEKQLSISPLFATLRNRSQITENTATLSPFLGTLTDFAPVSPVFATHTKTAGVWPNSSQFGTQSPLISSPIPYSLPSIPFIFILLQTLLRAQKTQLFCFQVIPHSLRKTPGGEGRGCTLLTRHSSSQCLGASVAILVSPDTGHCSPIPIHASSPIAARGPWCNNGIRCDSDHPARETYRRGPVSKDSERTSGAV
jgi:hypothetical protein